MKKLGFFSAALMAIAMAFTGCAGSAPKAELNNKIDSLSYAIGLAQTQGLKDYLVYRMGMDTAYIDDFIKGVLEAANTGDDKRATAYYTGLQIGQQISQGIVPNVNSQIFGEDSTQSISLKNFIAGFVTGTKGEEGLMKVNEADKFAKTEMEAVRIENLEKAYGENKKAGEEYMANIAKKEGVQALDNGVYYEVITEGKGEIPADANAKVKVHYEGKLIDGTVFDSSIERGEPTTFRCNQVIPGWTNALTHMPVGSKWIVYIPQDQAYGEREAGKIKPFSALTFTIELLSIEK